ncbi:hypothetical protein K469DRAFT_704782 [Zopfia rhizophila CBS 207.26]|uniref:Uncharacterized protein n=1 Tax=Zopfia rhizophila CBS 207.26 TaxID=1314779 RepID=A0A6A6E9L1_9PEZI|nr:hypothetical protein K469DRAFT_704782 [Zopfia rhizophila CBS 207.26]
MIGGTQFSGQLAPPRLPPERVKLFLGSLTAEECEPRPSTDSTPESAKAKAPDSVHETSCTGPQAHPFQTFKIHRMCAVCTRNRDFLLAQAENRNEVKFEEWRWKVRYLSLVPEEVGWSEWGGAGEMNGSWVADWKKELGKDRWMAALSETGQALNKDLPDGGMRVGCRSRMQSS